MLLGIIFPKEKQVYAVIFKAKEKSLDSQYSQMAQKMRELAFNKYNCKDFIAVSENGLEIAISYWGKLEDIKRWKADREHLVAQDLGQNKWYEAYKIEIVEILREYER